MDEEDGTGTHLPLAGTRGLSDYPLSRHGTTGEVINSLGQPNMFSPVFESSTERV